MGELMNPYKCLAVFACALAFIATAQSARSAESDQQSPATPTASASSPDNSVRLEEIVVTAQKRSQSLLDVPITITAVTGQGLQERDFSNITDLPDLIPGVRMNTPGGEVTPPSVFAGSDNRTLACTKKLPWLPMSMAPTWL